MLGRSSVATPTLGSLAGPFGLWQLLNKTVAVFGDARLSGQADVVTILERLLSISGGDPQNIDRKCLPTLVAVLMAVRFMILTNELPQLTDTSGAIASRFLVLKMVESFMDNEDKNLDAKLARELSGILNWSIDGWRRLRERGRFSQPDTGDELLQALKDITSPVGSFVSECCVVGPERSVAVSDIYSAWCFWAKSHGRDHPGTEQGFGRLLRAAVPKLTVHQGRRGSGIRVRLYNGIGFNSAGRHCNEVYPPP